MVIIMVIMARKNPFRLVYACAVVGHLRAIDPKYHSLEREAIEQQLMFEPDREMRNRKPLRQPAAFEAEWEIRFGPDNRFCVLYDIDRNEKTVQILAVGQKDGNRLRIGGEEIDL